MSRKRICVFAVLGTIVWALPALADDLEQHYRQTIEKLLPGMSAPALPDRQEPQQALEKLCHDAGSPGKEASREALSKAIMSFTGPSTAKPARVWLLRKIEPLGREEVVSGLTALLNDTDPDVRETARRALANNPSSEALNTLRAELSRSSDADWQVAIINALAWRHDEASTNALARLAGARDENVARAALSALGEIGNEAALKALQALEPNVPDGARPTYQDALLRGAERLVARGPQHPNPTALEALQPLSRPDQPEHLQIASLTQTARISGSPLAGGLLIRLIVAGDNPHMKLTAARLLERMDRKVTPAITEALPQSKGDATALLLEVLGNLGDPAAQKAVAGYVADADPEIRLAAIEALGKIGDGDAVAVLIKRASQAEGDEREAARNSLAALRGTDVDGIILKALETSQGPTQIELIQATWGRRITAAKALLLKLAGAGDDPVRTAVLNAMERLGDAQDLPQIVELLSRAESNAGREAGEKTLQSICRRAGNAEAATAPIVNAMAKADSRQQIALIHALGALQTMDALTAVRKATQSGDDAVKQAALAAIKNWKPIYMTTWSYAGPFRAEGKEARALFDTAFPPENGPDAEGFKPLKVKPAENGSIDLSKLPRTGTNCCCYLRAVIQSQRAQEVLLSMGSDDGIKMWLNGQVVHARNVERALRCDEDQARITLNEGANLILIKITQAAGGWEFCVGVKASDGGPPEGLQFEAR